MGAHAKRTRMTNENKKSMMRSNGYRAMGNAAQTIASNAKKRSGTRMNKLTRGGTISSKVIKDYLK